MSQSPFLSAGAPRDVGLLRLLDVLRCPVCGGRLRHRDGDGDGDGDGDNTLYCRLGHSFDIARDGHVSLLSGSVPISGDSAPMVRARQRFLDSGTYAPLRDAVARGAWDGARGHAPLTVIDAGCGTGYYLEGVLGSAPDTMPPARGLGLDASARALRIAARLGPRIATVACDLFAPTLPVSDGAADVILNVFAPHNPSEFHRMLRPSGRLVIARPTGRHLIELQRTIPGMVGIDASKERRLAGALAPFFDVTGAVTERVEAQMTLSPTQVVDLIAMTPSARHVRWESDRKIHPRAGDSTPGDQQPTPVTMSVLVTVYQRLA